MPQVISHPTFGNVSFPDDFTNQQIVDSFKNLENLQKPKAQEKQIPMSETAMNMASDIAVEGGVSTVGQLIGALSGPGYLAIAPASGAYGNYLKQQQQIARGEKKEVSIGEMVAAGLINLLPAANATKTLAKVGVDLAAKPLGTKIAYTAGLRAAEGAGIGGVSKTLEQTIEEGTFPTQDDFLSAVKAGGALGAVVGAGEAGLTAAFPKLSRGASKMWDTFAGKKASDVGAQLDNLRVNGTPEEKAAATEIIDEVGQRLGIINARPKSAQESGLVLATEQPTFVIKSTGGRAEAIPGGFGSETVAAATGLEPARVTAPISSALEAAADIPPVYTKYLGQAEQAARALLGDQAVEFAKKEGRILSVEQQASILQRQSVEQARLLAEAQARTTVPSRFGGTEVRGGPLPSAGIAQLG